MRFQTTAVHTGVNKDKSYNSVITPIYPSSTFTFDEIGVNKGYDYTRSGNPTRAALQENVAALEGGAGAFITCTGMAAITTSLFLFRPGDHIITGHDIYGGSYRLFSDIFTKQGLKFSFVDLGDLKNLENAITENTKAIWIETPSNPLLNVVDVQKIVTFAKSKNLTTIADNTFMSPFLFRPLDLGVDLVIHSTTKYINGHSDVVGGAIIAKTAVLAEQVGFLVNAIGTAGSPFDAWLVLRGVKTLPQRMASHQQNAMAIARFLDQHDKITHVYYPGLETHPQHELAKQQFKGFGGMLSFDIDENKISVADFFAKLQFFSLAESLGGVESLIEQPWTMSHASMDEAARINAGISTSTIRVSVGIEDADDLIDDLKQALS